jgi:rhodanese-related sulfurtransferase
VKFFIDNIFIVALVLLSGGALLVPAVMRRGPKVTLLEATQLMNQGKALILDVRTPAEFATGHVRDAKNIALNELAAKMAELAKYKDKPVIVVCQSGIRSTKALTLLKKAGFNQVVCMDGGMADWHKQGLPTVK